MIPKTLRMRLLAGSSALLVAGLVIGWLTAEDTPDTSKLAAPKENWQEPGLAQADAAKSVASLAQRPLWGDSGPKAGAAATDKPKSADWRLSGIVTKSGPPMAVILQGEPGKPSSHVQFGKIGDALPDGSHIVEITKTTMTVAGDSGQRQVKLFFPN
jgi:hypothetical protein